MCTAFAEQFHLTGTDIFLNVKVCDTMRQNLELTHVANELRKGSFTVTLEELERIDHSFATR